MVALDIAKQKEPGMKKYSHENWNQVLAKDYPDKERDLRLIGRMAISNLFWFVRRCISLDSDIDNFKRWPDWEHQFMPPSQFTKMRRKIQNEDSIGKN